MDGQKRVILPAPTADMPIRVSLEDTPDWLAANNLEIVGWDEKLNGMLVRKKLSTDGLRQSG